MNLVNSVSNFLPPEALNLNKEFFKLGGNFDSNYANISLVNN